MDMYVAIAPDEISYDGHIYERIGAAEQTGNVEVGTTILIFAYKIKRNPTPQPSQAIEMKKQSPSSFRDKSKRLMLMKKRITSL